MRNPYLSLIFIMVTLFYFSACSQEKASPSFQRADLIFKSNLRANGTAFYAMDSQSGQLYFMLDWGEQRGNWQKFGDVIRVSGTHPFQFAVVERNEATSFYALDGKSGQLYYTNDDNVTQGKWNTYGTIIRQNALNLLQFEAEGRFEGNSFYAFDSHSGQMYFMNDFGENAGKWAKYGSTLRK